MLPRVGPCAVGKGIADSVSGYGIPVVANKKISPAQLRIVSIHYGISGGDAFQTTGGKGILLPAEDISGVIFGSGGRKSAPLI